MATLAAEPDTHDAVRRLTDLCAAIGVPHLTNAPLGKRTWYGCGGSADLLARPHTVDQLQQLVAASHEHHVPLHVLGSGANLLVADTGVRGLVVNFNEGELAAVDIVDETRVIAAAGYDLMKLVSLTANRGLDGLQGLAGVPASVGGAVRMNAGGKYGDTGETLTRVRVMDADGRTRDIARRDIHCQYRHTNIAAPLIIEAEFALTTDHTAAPGRAESLRNRVLEIMAEKKASQPLGASSAGCTWKNPAPPPRYLAAGDPRACDPASDDPHRWPAGMLVDRAGLKGYTVGGATLSDKHANFIACTPDATATDILTVMRHAEAVVLKTFGVTLEREVVVWE